MVDIIYNKMSLEKYLKLTYDIPKNPKLLNILDVVPIYLDFKKYQLNLINFQNNAEHNSISIGLSIFSKAS